MDQFNQLRKECNQNQTQLRLLLTKPNDFPSAMQACLQQHACLHSSQISQNTPDQSLEDLVLDDLKEIDFRRIKQNQEHSIVWNLWHLARIEDCTMNTLVAGDANVFESEHWKEELNLPFSDTGNAMPCETVTEMSETINIPALLAYRQAVGKRTREILQNLQPQDLTKKVDPLRLQVLIINGCVRREAQGLIDYWSKRTTAGLLLMPATRHNLVHLNEIHQLKQGN